MYRISYTGDGQLTEFVFAFPFFQPDDVRVALDEQIQDKNTYSVIPNEDFNGGTVVFSAPINQDVRIDIFRQIALTRVIDYQPTAKIDPEDLNTDFNFLLAAFCDLHAPDIDLVEWANTHANVVQTLEFTNQLIQDKLAGGAVLGIYRNLLMALDYALPQLINDYGLIADAAQDDNRDDYGIL